MLHPYPQSFPIYSTQYLISVLLKQEEFNRAKVAQAAYGVQGFLMKEVLGSDTKMPTIGIQSADEEFKFPESGKVTMKTITEDGKEKAENVEVSKFDTLALAYELSNMIEPTTTDSDVITAKSFGFAGTIGKALLLKGVSKITEMLLGDDCDFESVFDSATDLIGGLLG